MKIFSILIICLFYLIKINNCAPPELYDKYSWGNDGSLSLIGNGFSTTNDNQVMLNGNSYSCGIANNSITYPGYQAIFCPSTATLLINYGELFTALVISNGENSNSRVWYLIRPISVSLIARLLNTIGGYTQFQGVYTTTNISIIKLWIGGEACQVVNVEPIYDTTSRLYFYYPYKATTGDYELFLQISGLEYKTIVKYVSAGAPTLLQKYSWTTLPNNKTVMTFYGYRFTTMGNYNLITINGINYNASAIQSDGATYQIVTLLDDTATKSLNDGDLLIINVNVAGLTLSYDEYFYLFRSLSITKIQPLFQSIGGTSTIEGVFGYSANPTFYFANSPIQRFDFSSNAISFTYPVRSAGTYQMVLNIGGYEIAKDITYITSPPPSIINKYLWVGNQFVLNGNWFGYYSQNLVTINNESIIYVGPPSIIPSPLQGYDCIQFELVNFNSTTLGVSFNVTVQVEGQLSNTVNFVYLESISMSATQTLNITGGIVSFDGSYTVSDVNVVQLSINQVACQVLSISPSSIKFRYPPMLEGQYTILINIGGLDYSTTVRYIVPPLPLVSEFYKWSLSNKLIITGKSFSYVNHNYILINDVNYNATLAVGSELPGYDEITYDDISLSSILHEDQLFTVQVSTGGLFSNIVTFNYIEKISITPHDIYNFGGIGSEFVTLPGIYGTSNTSIVSLSIGDIECKVNSIEPNSIKFSYGLLQKGESSVLLINIGGLEYKTTINVIQTPKPILLNGYYWSSSQDSILVFKGKSFNYLSSNEIKINDIKYNSTAALLNNGNDEITFNFSSIASSLAIGDSFTVVVNNSIDSSNSIDFIYIKSISIETASLNDTGGLVTFSGEYHVSNTNVVSLLIDGSMVEVTNISKTEITFKYPSKSVGQYNLLINIGGFEKSTTVSYVTTPTPSPTSSSSDDTPSTSSNLSISIFLTTFTFLLYLL